MKQLPQVNKLAELNELLQLEDTDSLWKALKHPDIGLNNLDERNRGRICVCYVLFTIFSTTFNVF